MIKSFDLFGSIPAILGAIIGLITGVVLHAGWWIIATTIAGFLIGWICGVGFEHILIRAQDRRDQEKENT